MHHVNFRAMLHSEKSPFKNIPTETREIMCSSSHRNKSLTESFIPYRLYGTNGIIHEWPKTTNVLCWNCRHPFEGVPVSAPMQFDIVNHVWEVKGVFCSLNCCKRYLIEEESYNTPSRMMWLRLFGKRYFNFEGNIKPALPFESLLKYGGHLSIEAFRQAHVAHGTTVRKIEKPFVSFPTVFSLSIHEKKDSINPLLNNGQGRKVSSRFNSSDNKVKKASAEIGTSMYNKFVQRMKKDGVPHQEKCETDTRVRKKIKKKKKKSNGTLSNYLK
jgi:hypothetical protein